MELGCEGHASGGLRKPVANKGTRQSSIFGGSLSKSLNPKP